MDWRFTSKSFPEIHPVVQLMSLLEDAGIVKSLHGRDYVFNEALNVKMFLLPDKVIDALVVFILVLALLSGKAGF